MLANGIWIDQLYMASHNKRTFEKQWRSIDSGHWYLRYATAQFMNHEQELGLSDKELEALDFDYNSLIRHGKAELLRSSQEGIAFAFKYGVDIMKDMGMKMKPISSGGGTDANVFYKHKIKTPIISTGMKEVHSVKEYLLLKEFFNAAIVTLRVISKL